MNVTINRVLQKVAFDHDCWKWNGRHDEDGYGRTCFGDRTNVMVHRVMYEAFIAPIADGCEIDHLCRNRGCCNPLHLEPVPHRVNSQRGAHPQALNTHCPSGHEFTTANTRTTTHIDASGFKHTVRQCRTCCRIAMQRYRERRDTAARSV